MGQRRFRLQWSRNLRCPIFRSGNSSGLAGALATTYPFGYTCSMNKTANGFLERILEPVSSSLNEEAARKLIGLKADRRIQARVATLAEKCNDGNLTPHERREYEMYVMAGHLVAILQAKARV